jgi:DNA-binding CsgD family transcriptional regulator
MDAVPYHREALDLFERLDDRRGIAESLDLLGPAFILTGYLSQAEHYLRRAVAAFRELDDRQALASSQGMLATTYSASLYLTLVPLARDMREGIHEGEQAIAAARAVGWRAGEAYALNTLGTHLIWLGEYRRGLALIQAGLELAGEIGHRQWMMHGDFKLGLGYEDLLEHATARRHLEQALTLAHEIDSAFWITFVTGCLALVLVGQGQLDDADTLLQQASDGDSTVQSLGIRTCAYARARLALARGRPQSALRIVDQQVECAPGMAPGKVIPRLSWLRGDILIRLGRVQDAERELTGARRAAEQLEMRLLLWRIHLSLGTLFLGQGRDTDALQSLAAARSMIDELAASAPDDLRETFRSRAAALFPSPPPMRAAMRPADGLTAREHEVLRLVAEGLTDPQIAERLSVSPRTVHAHLRSIYNKLDVPSRAAAVRLAVERRLI